MAHVVLLGDSVFDNARYVPQNSEVQAHLRERLGAVHRVTLLAQDGAVLANVPGQLKAIKGLAQPPSHLVISAGGNNVLGLVPAMQSTVRTVQQAADLLAAWQTEFRREYLAMLDAVRALGTPYAVSTVYDSVPGLAPGSRGALALFNDVILREAARRRVPVLDLRLVCDQAADYSDMSPIEPSAQGGRKIAAAIAELVLGHDPCSLRTVIHGAGIA
ncbi:GDSL-like lipase/acylhydrolase family protein [Pseudoduganella flava]|uniref:GDSL-like lipase/acylhydrolase family protein n=1 Tax=Pseudoduganella flava TaxID=871742 RepID=A0A562Q0W1_9BURK|nr:SGNH/GDSL hydrolase family protein [Pseudoduganella flava]QGZ38187.1 SGNH/GDSL hydrolase family protein [Pseudoduganella flava]TWI50288.1 GDSL-like lipase/acylhydrolase family protein [Pseudoduganella flava]